MITAIVTWIKPFIAAFWVCEHCVKILIMMILAASQLLIKKITGKYHGPKT